MRVDSINWSPVRLESRRVGNNCQEIFRDGKLLGRVQLKEGRWHSWKPGSKYYPNGERTIHSSWHGAVLYLARYFGIYLDSDGPQDFGMVRMLRVCCGSCWYTIIDDGHSRYVYADFGIPSEPAGISQARLRRAVDEADRHLRAHPVRNTRRVG